MNYSNNIHPAAILMLVFSLSFSTGLQAQQMTLDEVIGAARTRSVEALEAKSSFVSDYWAWRSYQASRLPSLTLYGELGSFDRSLRLLQNYETGEMVYTENYNMQNSLGLQAKQNISFTGGTLYLFSELTRIDQFGASSGNTWYAQPVTLSYSQPLFAYNRFKWDRLISPKEYEKAKRVYLEAMEDVTLEAVTDYYAVMLARKVYDASVVNYDNISKMLGIARERLSLGSITRDEYLQLELRMLNDSISIHENEVALKKADMVLNSLLSYDESHSIETVTEERLPDVVMDFDLVLDKASSNSSFNLENAINLLNADSAVAQAKASRGITMQINARFGLTNSASGLPETYKNLLDQEIVGLSFSIPIFDWGEGKGKVKKAEAASDVIKAQVEQAENDKRISLYTAVGQFNNQRRLCEVSQKASKIAEERYSLIMEKFRTGKATVTDLNTARSENDSAMQKYVGDLGNFWTYYYTLRKLSLYDFLAAKDITVSYDEMVK